MSGKEIASYSPIGSAGAWKKIEVHLTGIKPVTFRIPVGCFITKLQGNSCGYGHFHLHSSIMSGILYIKFMAVLQP